MHAATKKTASRGAPAPARTAPATTTPVRIMPPVHDGRPKLTTAELVEMLATLPKAMARLDALAATARASGDATRGQLAALDAVRARLRALVVVEDAQVYDEASP